MLHYRQAEGIESIRTALVADLWLPNDELDLEQLLERRYPCQLPEFEPIVQQIWGGLLPSIPHGYDSLGNLVTVQLLTQTEFDKISAAGLDQTWLRMVQYCDVFYDLVLHALTVRHGRLIARHDIVDAAGVTLTTLGVGSVRMISQVLLPTTEPVCAIGSS